MSSSTVTSLSTVPSLAGFVPVADKILGTLDRFLHIEALSGIVLLIARGSIADLGLLRQRTADKGYEV